MRLSEKEARILACIELRANISISEVSKATGFREHTVRYTLSSLEKKEIISKSPFINLFRLGYTLHNIFFSLSSDNKRIKDSLLSELEQIPEVSWVAEFGGDFQYGIEICAFELADVKRILYDLSKKFGNIFFQKAVSTQYAAHLLPRRYLAGNKVVGCPLLLKRSGGIVAIDERDEQILSALAKKGGESHRKLAAEIGIPLSTFELRVKKLTDSNVIAGSFYSINPELFGMSSYKLIVYAKGISSSFRDRLLEFSDNHPSLISLHECFGSWDYELGVEVETPQRVAEITQELYDEFGDDMNNIQVLSKFRTLKVVMFPTHQSDS